MNDNVWTTIGLIFFGIVAGFYLFLIYIRWRFNLFVNRVFNDAKQMIEEQNRKLVPLLIEKEKDVFYCYAEEDRKFLCQGRTVHEVKSALNDVLPDKIPYIGDSTNKNILEEFKSELTEVEVPQ